MESRPRRMPRRVFFLLVGLLLVFTLRGALRAGPAPAVTLTPERPAIGRRTPVVVTVEEPKRGISRLRVELVQGDRVEMLAERTWNARGPWQMWGERIPREELRLEVGSETIQGLRGGTATLRATADRAGSWLRHPEPVVTSLELPVKLTPPRLSVQSIQTYVAQGGAEAVVYQVGEDATRHGVQAGSWWFPGFPLPGASAGTSFALFAAPYDQSDPGEIRLVAEDVVGNRAERAFVDKFFAKPLRTDTIQLSDGFMSRVVPEILGQSPEVQDRGNLLDNYLMINRDLRAKNAETLVELASKSAPEFLWRQAFLPMRNAQVMSSFADRRTYVLDGRTVDQQDHLGFDLASVERAEIHAANDGRVVLARYFGIYGNAVIVDHGFGLMTLYGHLSDIAVAEGDSVTRGQVLGRSGATGLAGGDHLHFSVLLQGHAIDPREWWDAHWIADRLKRKLGAGLGFGG